MLFHSGILSLFCLSFYSFYSKKLTSISSWCNLTLGLCGSCVWVLVNQVRTSLNCVETDSQVEEEGLVTIKEESEIDEHWV